MLIFKSVKVIHWSQVNSTMSNNDGTEQTQLDSEVSSHIMYFDNRKRSYSKTPDAMATLLTVTDESQVWGPSRTQDPRPLGPRPRPNRPMRERCPR